MAAAAKGGLKCLQVCGYCCQLVACSVGGLKSVWGTFTKVFTCGQGWKGLIRNSGTMCISEEDPDYKDFELPVVEERQYTDIPGFIAFLATLIGMCVAMHMGLAYGKPTVFTNGVDSWGNICGQTNIAYSGVTISGKDMTNFPRVLIADFLSNSDALSSDPSKKRSLCVRLCPLVTASFQCRSYLSNNTNYPVSVTAQLCNGATSAELAFDEKNKRCVPSHVVKGLSIQKQNALMNLYSQNWLHNVVHDCHVCAAELTWITLIALAFTMVFLLVMHGAAAALCYYSFTTFFVMGIAATSYMWYLYTLINAVDTGISVYSASGMSVYVENSDEATTGQSFEASMLQAALQFVPRAFVHSPRSAATAAVPQAGYSIVFRDAAIVSTSIVVGFGIVCFLVGRRSMDACAVLFEYATESIMEIKWVYLLPIYTMCSLALGFGLWLYTVKHITAIFKADLAIGEDSSSGLASATYVPDTTYSTWVLIFEFVAIIWILNFIMACQHLTTSLVVGTWYFSVEKAEMYRPMRVASSRLIRRHLGTAATGSFFSGYFGIFRAPLSFLQSRVVTSLEHARNLEREYMKKNSMYNEDHIYDEPMEDDLNEVIYDEPAPSAAPEDDPDLPPYDEEEVVYDDVMEEDEISPYSVYDPVEVNMGEWPPPSAPPPKTTHSDPTVAVGVWSWVNNACSPFFWILNHVLIYISDINYHMVALEGCWFFAAGRMIQNRLEKQQNLKGITAVSSFAMFLGKVTVTLSVLPFGFILLKDKAGVFMYGYPLAVGALLSYLISHVFISLFESAVGAVFVCYLEDTSINKGDKLSPYFGKKRFFRSLQNALNETTTATAPPYTKHHYDADPQKKMNRAQKMQMLREMNGEYERMEQGEDDDRELNPTDPSSIFLLMPKKAANQTPGNHVYETGYDIAEMFEENIDDLDEERQKKKKDKEKKEKSGENKKNDKSDKQKSEAKKQTDTQKQTDKKTNQKDKTKSTDKNNMKKSETKKEKNGKTKADSAKKGGKSPDKKPKGRSAKQGDSAKPKTKNDSAKNKPKTGKPPKRPPPPKKAATNKNKTKPAKPKAGGIMNKKNGNISKAKGKPKVKFDQNLTKSVKKPKMGKTQNFKKPGMPKTAKPQKMKLPRMGKAHKGRMKAPGKLPKMGKFPKMGKAPKMGKFPKTGKFPKMGKFPKRKAPKMPKLPKIGKMKGIGKMKQPKIPKIKMPGMKMKRGGLRGMGKLGAADIADGVGGAVNIADGLLQLTGKKEGATSALQNAAFGTRNRSKATALASHVVANRLDFIENGECSNWKFAVATKDLIWGGKEVLEDVDRQWDEAEGK
ncbi:uncharacterized protein LOC144750089 [Ciona intestinalis]